MNNKVLVVDDGRLTAELARAMLTHGGIDTEVVHSGANALDWLSSHQAALILSDWFMPDMTGGQLAQNLRTRYSTTHAAAERPWLIAYTAYLEDQERAVILASGFDEVVQKPARTDVLLFTVRRWLNRSRVD